MMNLLPAAEQEYACEFIKRILIAGDHDYTKLTADEEALQAAKSGVFWRSQKLIGITLIRSHEAPLTSCTEIQKPVTPAFVIAYEFTNL